MRGCRQDRICMVETETSAPRLDWKIFQEAVPEFATSMAAITHALKKSGIEPELRELIKIRASQINRCAFCVQFHLNDARKLKVPAEKLDLLAAWREAGVYSEREAAALGVHARLAPCRQQVQLLRGHLQLTGVVEVKLDAERAAVDLRRANLDQLAQLRLNARLLQCMSNRRHAGGKLRHSLLE